MSTSPQAQPIPSDTGAGVSRKEKEETKQQQQYQGGEGKESEMEVEATSPIASKYGRERTTMDVSGAGPATGVTAAGVGMATSYPTSDAFLASLARMKADRFTIVGSPQDQPIWAATRDDLVIDVWNGLVKRNISAVPVLLKTQAKYYAFLSLTDIVRYVVEHFGTKAFAQERSFMELLDQEKVFATKTVDDLLKRPLTWENPFHPIRAGYSAFAVVEALARERGLHRVPIISDREHAPARHGASFFQERRMVNLVTQSQCVAWLHRHLDELGEVLNKPMSACAGVIKPVISIKDDSIAIDAFNLMVEKEVVGLAIVDANGRLKGNISMRDLKTIGTDASLFWRLHQSVKNFIAKLRHEYQARHGRPRTIVYVLPSATIKDVIQTLAEHRIHRIYICDTHQDKKPIGVVTLQDLLLEIISN